MPLLSLVFSPDPRLKQKSQPVEHIDDAFRAFLDDMLETMYASEGLGLAAVQVGVLKRALVLDIEQDERGVPVNPMKLINPHIVRFSEEKGEYREGCLSFPGQFEEVTRPAEIEVEYTDENGELRTLKADGLLATCIQHEIDHLDGVTFVDHISRLKRDMILRKMKKAGKP